MSSPPHVVAIPYPAQGHVIPLMELCLCLVKHGFKVTFVNSEFNHKRVIKALSKNDDDVQKLINLVSIPDGLGPEDDRTDLKILTEAICKAMPGKFEDLIREMNESEVNGISCVIVDVSIGWPFEVAEKLGIRRVAFWPAAAANLAVTMSFPKLIDDGIIDATGAILKEEIIQLSPDMPNMNPADFIWTCFSDPALRRLAFDLLKENAELIKSIDWVICNSSKEMEPGAFTLFPQLTPIGPLLASNRLGKTVGHFWPEDLDCLKWLDQQPRYSVIYVAFGSHTMINRTQFQELALGLELSNRPFLWVVREDFIVDKAGSKAINSIELPMNEEADSIYPKGFRDRVANRGQFVGWTPQQEVLAHPSIACFLSHCGWNSTVEGVSNGVPFLCWPYFADQFFNQSYICDVWKVGLNFNKNESGIIGKEQIKSKIDEIFEDDGYKTRALELQAKVISSVKEGCSNKNFCDLVARLKSNG